MKSLKLFPTKKEENQLADFMNNFLFDLIHNYSGRNNITRQNAQKEPQSTAPCVGATNKTF